MRVAALGSALESYRESQVRLAKQVYDVLHKDLMALKNLDSTTPTPISSQPHQPPANNSKIN